MDAAANPAVARPEGADHLAPADLIERHYAKVYAFLRRLAGNEADAADLTQSTFARAWEALPSFAGRSSVASWIHGVAHHVYVDWRRAARPSAAQPDDWWADCPASGTGPDDAVAQSDLARAVYAAVDGLEPDLGETVRLHYYQELTIQETADALGIAPSTVKYRLRQALAQLQKHFDESRPNRSAGHRP